MRRKVLAAIAREGKQPTSARYKLTLRTTGRSVATPRGSCQLEHPQHDGMGLFGHAELFEDRIPVVRLGARVVGAREVEPADEDEVAQLGATAVCDGFAGIWRAVQASPEHATVLTAVFEKQALCLDVCSSVWRAAVEQ